MSGLNLPSFLTDFTVLPDPRLARRRQYPLLEILLLCVSANLSGYEEWDEIVDFSLAKLAWPRRYLSFAAGIPAHDMLNRAMSRLEPRGFNEAVGCLTYWPYSTWTAAC